MFRAGIKKLKKSPEYLTAKEAKQLFRQVEKALDLELGNDPAWLYLQWLEPFGIDFGAIKPEPARIEQHTVK